MIFNKKSIFQNKSTESIGKPKDLWKALKSLGLPNKASSCEVKALKIINTMLTQYQKGLKVIAQLWQRTL